MISNAATVEVIDPVVPTAGARAMSPRVLTFTTLFPNREQPLHGLFVRERIRALAKLCALRVVAPVPWAPPVPGLPQRYAAYREVHDRDNDDGVPVHHPRFVVIPKLLKSTDALLMAASCLLPLAAIRRAFPFELVDAHWAYPDGVAAALLAQYFDVPFALTVRGDDINVFAAERGRGPSIRWALRRAAIVIALSAELKVRVDGLTDNRARVAVVPNGVDVDRFHPMNARDARRRLGIDPRGRVLITVGRLHQSKGIPDLVDAVGTLPDGFEDVRLFIIGPHDAEADARRAIATSVSRHGLHRRVQIVGPQTPDQLVDWYNAANLFCSATTREGSPNVLIEAMACGLPCVTTPVGGNPEVVGESGGGVLVPPEPAALARAISDALTRRWNRDRIAAWARRRTWDAVAGECHRQLLGVLQPAS